MKWVSPVIALLLGFFFGAFFFSGSSEDSGVDQMSPAQSGSGVIQSVASGTAADFPASSEAAGEGAMVAAEGAITEEWLDSLKGLSSFDQFGILHKRLSQVPVSEMETIMDDLVALGGSPLSWQSRSMVATRWAELDPKGLQRYIEDQPRNMKWGLNAALYSSWAKTDLSAALASADQMEDNERAQAISGIVGTIAEESPQKALSLLEQHLNDARHSSWTYRNMFQAWGSRDREAALVAAYSLEDDEMRASALIGAMSELARENPTAALEWMDSQEQNRYFKNEKRQLLNQILREDVDSVLSYIDSRESSLEQRDLLQGIHFSQLGDHKDFDEIMSIMNWVEVVATGNTYTNKVRDVMSAMVRADPERAVDYFTTLRPGAARLQAVNSVASALAEKDIDAALNFFNSLEYEDERQRAMSAMSWRLVQNHPERAKALLANSDDPTVQSTLSHQLAQALAEEDRDAALEWLPEIKDESWRSNALQNILSSWVVEDPVAAFDYIGRIEDESKMAELYSSAINRYFNEDPAGGVEWLEKLSAKGVLGKREDNSYRQAASAYVRHDPMAASEWIATLEPGKNRDGAVDSLVRQIHRTDPEAGFAWGVTMEDENRRRRNLEMSVREWVKTDRDAASQAIERAEISVEEKERLFKLLPDQS